jgi:hypothetical protein
MYGGFTGTVVGGRNPRRNPLLFYVDFCVLSLFSKKLKCFFMIYLNTANPEMNRKQQEQELFNKTAQLLADDKITPEQACSFIETLRDAGILADDILDPENLEQEKQKGFNEIAGVFSDWKITTEEACELFNEWTDEWKVKK